MKTKKEYKIWETLIMSGKVIPTKATLEDTKKKRNGAGAKPSPALVDIIERVCLLDIEDPLRYDFPEEGIAQNFKAALDITAAKMNVKEKIHVNRSMATVYVYRMQ